MDMNRAFFNKRTDHKPKWRVFDAEGQVVGRFATQVANALRGKDQPTYTPHVAGDYVVIINAEKVVFTGNKMEEKLYTWYTGYIGGQKTATAADFMRKDPAEILRHAIEGMLPKNNALSNQIKRRLKIYVGSEHPHKAQV